MTLIIGIRCDDGIVLGADGMATFGNIGLRTIQQPARKLTRIGDSIAIGTSGPVGLAQRFSSALQELWDNKKLAGKAPHEAMTILQGAFWQYAEKEFKAAQVTAPLLGQAALESAMSSTVLAIPLEKKPCLINFNHQCSPEQASGDLPFISVGSGQPLADSFLAFLRRIFWSDHPPRVNEGVLATLWSLEQAIRTNPGGVGHPIQIMTLEKVDGEWKVRELGQSDLGEHQQAIADAERVFAKFRDFVKPSESESAPPEPSSAA